MDPEETYPLATWNSDGTGITATEVAHRLKAAEKNFANAYRDAFIAKFAQAKSVVRTDGVVAAPPGVSGEPKEDADYLLLERIFELPELIMSHGFPVSDISVMLPEESYVALLALAEAEDLAVNPTPFDPATLLRARFFLIGIEVLCGGRLVTEPVAIFARLGAGVDANSKALLAKIQRCLTGGRITELPKSPSGDRVSPRAETIGKIPVTSSAAGRDNRDSNSLAHLSDEAKVIAAKEAIAAYARNKQLPSAAHLALFGELDGKRAGNKGPGLGQAGWMPAPAWHAQIDRLFDDIKRNDHRLSAEPLSRAIDQIWVRENGGAYADLVCSRAERLAEMVCRTEAAADG